MDWKYKKRLPGTDKWKKKYLTISLQIIFIKAQILQILDF